MIKGVRTGASPVSSNPAVHAIVDTCLLTAQPLNIRTLQYCAEGDSDILAVTSIRESIQQYRSQGLTIFAEALEKAFRDRITELNFELKNEFEELAGSPHFSEKFH